MFCLKCGAVIDDKSDFCSECGERIDKVSCVENDQRNSQGETIVYASQISNENEHSQSVSAGTVNFRRVKVIIIIGVVLCMASICLVVFGYKSITDSSYEYAVDNYDYYKSQMTETSTMAKIYGGGGILGGAYSNLSSSWEDMLDEARERIVMGRIKAGVGFVGGIVVLVFGIILLFKNYKKIRMLKDMNK